MNLKARVEKLEAKKQGGGVLVLTINDGDSEEEALAAWKAETGKPVPKLVIFVVKFCNGNNWGT